MRNKAYMNCKSHGLLFFIIILILLPNILYGQNRSLSVQQVPVWGIFEAEVKHDKNYSDPFRDVTLEVNLTRPDGDTIAFWGFHDGENSWRIRFMPDHVGIWSYVFHFSDESKVGEGRFEVTESAIPGLIGQDVANPNWFGFKSGKHAVIRSFHVGDRFFAANWPTDKRNEFLDWAQSQGYNLLSVASFFLNRNEERRGKGWETPELWNSKSNAPNPEAYRQAETILDELGNRNMMVYPFAGFFGQSSDFPRNADDQELYIRYSIARLGAWWNLLYNVAGPEPLWRPDAFNNQMPASEIIRLGKLIKDLDPYGHIISVHNETGTDPFRYEDWHGYVTLQGGKEKPGSSVYNYIEKHGMVNKPVYAQEVFWPGNMYHECLCTDVEEIRKKAFLLLFAGAAINFADMDGNSSSGFSGLLDPELKHQERHDVMKSVWDWFESIPFYRMKPQKKITSNGYVLAEDGVRYAVYLPDGGQPATLDLSYASGSYNLSWYNPKTQQYFSDEKSITGNSEITLNPPSEDKEQDFIALIERIDPKEFYESEGKISIEAEHAVAVNGWKEVEGKSGKAMRDIGHRDEGFMDYPVTFNEPGNYYIYMLMRRTNKEDSGKANDAYVTLAGQRAFGSDGFIRPEGIRCSQMAFTWESNPKGPGAHTPRHIFNDPIYFKIPVPGTYTFRIGSRSTGFEVDKIIITKKKERPVDLGAPETIQTRRIQ